MDSALKQLVRDRAGNRCEYCHIRQEHEAGRPFHIEHIIARQHGGKSLESNLALACHLCNWLKGPNLSGLDPDTGLLTRLFHPRTNQWSQHLLLTDSVISGITDIGPTTVWLLDMNCEERVELREILIGLGEAL